MLFSKKMRNRKPSSNIVLKHHRRKVFEAENLLAHAARAGRQIFQLNLSRPRIVFGSHLRLVNFCQHFPHLQSTRNVFNISTPHYELMSFRARLLCKRFPVPQPLKHCVQTFIQTSAQIPKFHPRPTSTNSKF